MYFEKKYRQAVWVTSLAVAVVMFALIIINRQYVPEYPYLIPLEMKVNYAITIAILVAITPSAVIEYSNNRWLKQVDENIPRLLTDLAESIRSGMPLVRALEEATKRDYGPVTGILETAVVNFNLTSDLEGSLRWFGEKLLRPNGKRLATILMEAYNSGGRMMDILETSIQMFTSVDEYREDKQANIGPYVLLFYVSNLIFLFIGWVVVDQFLTPLSQQNINTPGVASLIGNMLSINYYKAIIYWAAIVEGIVGGLVAGKIINSRVLSGLFHSVILTVITYQFFIFFV